MGDPARQLPLRRGAPGRHRRERARRRLRDALGLRHAAQGPFELWQAGRLDAGRAVGQGRHRRRQGAVSNAPLPAWVFDGPAAATPACTRRRLVERRASTLRRRRARCRSTSASRSARACSAPTRRTPLKAGTEVFKNDEVRVWTLDGEVLIASITAKLHLISPRVIEGLLKAVELAEQSYQGLVIWSPDDVFSAGANLEALMPVFMKSGGKGIAARGQEAAGRDAAAALRAACRWSRRCAASRSAAAARWRCYSRERVAAMESYIGLVEVGVGLIPGGGGLTYIARRAAEMAAAGSANADLLQFLDRRLHQRRDGQGRHQRDRVAQARLPAARATSIVPQQGRAAATSRRSRSRRWPRAAGARR